MPEIRINIKISLIYWLFPYPDREIPGNEPGNQAATIPATDRNRTGIQVIGPGDETIARIQDVYRKVLYIRHSDEKRLTVVKEKVEQYIEMNEGYQKIHIQYERV